MTQSQASFLKRLSEERGAEFDPNLTKAAASRRIDELLAQGRGPSRPAAKRERAAPSSGTKRRQQREVEGEKPMTAAQEAYLKELSEEEGGDFEPDLTKDEAARRIGELLSGRAARANPTEPSRR